MEVIQGKKVHSAVGCKQYGIFPSISDSQITKPWIFYLICDLENVSLLRLDCVKMRTSALKFKKDLQNVHIRVRL